MLALRLPLHFAILDKRLIFFLAEEEVGCLEQLVVRVQNEGNGPNVAAAAVIILQL